MPISVSSNKATRWFLITSRLTRAVNLSHIPKLLVSSETSMTHLHETSHSVWLKWIESIRTRCDYTAQCGTERPAPFERSSLMGEGTKDLVRTKEYLLSSPGDILYSGCGREAFFPWDGKPLEYADRG